MVTASDKQLEFVDAFLSRDFYIHAAVGGNRCLGPNTLIESPDGPARRVADITGPHRVWAWGGTRVVAADADRPFIKSRAMIWRVTLASGATFDCSDGHLLLTPDGWRAFADMREGSAVVRAVTQPQAVPVSMMSSTDVIVSIRGIGMDNVWDFHVPGWNNYATCGAVHHNSGKTYTTVHICLALWLRDHAKSGDVYWVVSPTFEKTVTVQGEIWNALPKSMLGSTNWTPINGFGVRRVLVINLPSGGTATVRFKSADQPQESFEADKLSGVLIDETIGEDLFQRLHARLVDKGGWILISTIPDADWMVEQLEEATERRSDIWFQKFQTMDNVHNLGVENVERFRDNLTDEEKDMRFLGNFRSLQGLVYKEFIRDRPPKGHVCDPFAIPDYWPKWRAIDWGNKSPTACVWGTISPNGVAYVYREYYRADRDLRDHARDIIAMSGDETYAMAAIIDVATFKVDQANNTSIAMAFRAAGIDCMPSIKTSHSGKDATVQEVKRRLTQRTQRGDPMLQVFSSCVNTISEFRKHRYKLDRMGRPTTADTYERKNDHALDALRYWLNTFPAYRTPGHGGGGIETLDL